MNKKRVYWSTCLQKHEMESALTELLFKKKFVKDNQEMRTLVRFGFMTLTKSDMYTVFYKHLPDLEKILNK